jgi:hypothetical protein
LHVIANHQVRPQGLAIGPGELHPADAASESTHTDSP